MKEKSLSKVNDDQPFKIQNRNDAPYYSRVRKEGKFYICESEASNRSFKLAPSKKVYIDFE